MYSAQFLDAHHAPAMLPLDAFERFTFDQMFAPSDFESADLDSEVEAEVERESEAESRRGRRTAAPPPAATDDERDAADVESRAQSDAAEGLVLVCGQYLHAAQSDAESKKENGGNNRTWEADLSRMVALRKQREREHFSRMETIRPSSFHHFQSHSSLRRPFPEVVPTHTEADNLLLFHPPQHHLPLLSTSNTTIKAIPPITNLWNTVRRDPSREASTLTAEPALDFVGLSPLHFPSLLSLALSILPEIKTRTVAKIKFWILPAAFTLPRHLDDLNEKLGAAAQTRSGETATAVWDEKRGLVVGSDVDDVSSGGDGKSTAIMLFLPAVGAIAAAAAALGIWAADAAPDLQRIRAFAFAPLASVWEDHVGRLMEMGFVVQENVDCADDTDLGTGVGDESDAAEPEDRADSTKAGASKTAQSNEEGTKKKDLTRQVRTHLPTRLFPAETIFSSRRLKSMEPDSENWDEEAAEVHYVDEERLNE
ncbi:hypothetical protein M407DRAFT_33388 [Tulasnella calospora MUT 4182]|uniref:Uncharacterized protein n=1 Tax=Tulasnella calospora MUT 4182 TaxID=1051891 RepID=A0A0C3K6G0_9AGAM|nr:hypothetical protein M407DRAFT_33388 [Tulasnella calospora MUT 4182]